MRGLGNIVTDGGKAHSVYVVHVLGLLVDPDQLHVLVQLRSNDDRHRGNGVINDFVERVILGDAPTGRGIKVSLRRTSPRRARSSLEQRAAKPAAKRAAKTLPRTASSKSAAKIRGAI